MRRALGYPLKLIAKNAGVNGSVVIEKVCLCYSVFGRLSEKERERGVFHVVCLYIKGLLLAWGMVSLETLIIGLSLCCVILAFVDV